MKTIIIIQALSLVVCLPGVTATNLKPLTLILEKSKSEVEFLAVGTPSAIKIRGKVKEEKPAVNGVLRLEGTEVKGSAVVLLDEFDTGIELRNRHMKEKYLETAKWPTAELVVTKMTLPENCRDSDCESSKNPLEGTLSLHGVKKTLSGIANVKKRGNELEADFDFKFPLSDFGIETPTFMGISVTQDVAVTVGLNGTLVSQ